MASLIRNPLDCYCQLVQLTRGERALSSHCSGTFSHIVSSENPLSRALQYLFRIARRQDGERSERSWMLVAFAVTCRLVCCFHVAGTEADTGVNGPDESGPVKMSSSRGGERERKGET